MTAWSTSPLRRFARREWGPLYWTVRDTLAAKGWRAVPMSIGAVLLTTVFQIVQNQSWGFQPVQNLGSVKAVDPFWLALIRTPLSLFVPALDLPVWGALLQMLLVFGIAEICIGWWRTLLIGYVATLAGTTYARIGLSLSPEHPFGLPLTDRVVNDTGPSAAVVGLAVFVCWRYRAYVTGGLVIAAMIIEVAVKNNLAGKEHLAAIAAVMVVCLVRATWGARRRVPPGRRPPPPPSPTLPAPGGPQAVP
ncbi:hypothetical protein [Streptomyces sp. G-G2]|uniref:hypothetical protein n=1 Tax=Streptomyces sp. G-G2 TaxID=3046201 RepID=UPI0024B9EA30|nr:hypothetical protein [Streptomyces sp. G-G2]MDJ0383289.1 hypothetical protein [Streptomyces sp. G-G2]